MMEKICPRCKSSSHQVPDMKLFVNSCGHQICGMCVDAVFVHPSGPCPKCGVTLRKNLYRLLQFEDSRVEIEVDIRKKVLKDYNKTEQDFATLREYNDYLEEVETIIYNLSNGIDVEEMKIKMESYRKENQAIITKNRARQQRQEQALVTQLEQEKLEVELRNEEALFREAEAARMKKRQKESIIDELMKQSDLPANEVLASHIAAVARARGEEALPAARSEITYPSHKDRAGTTVFDVLPTEAVGKPYLYVAPIMNTYGPEVPGLEELEQQGYLSCLDELEDIHKGGGFLPAYACQRALQEAFSCLLLLPDDTSATKHDTDTHTLTYVKAGTASS